MTTTAPPPERPAGPKPVLKVTGYDRASAFVIAAVLGTGMTAFLLFAAWASQHEWAEPVRAVPFELVASDGGGVEDGSETETLDLKTPFEETPDPSLAEIRDDRTEIAPTLDSIVDLAGRATEVVAEQAGTGVVNTGNPGSATGTGRRALGLGPGDGGMPREQRWFVRFAEGGTTSDYARQLDHFGIELGALLPGGRLVYVANLSGERPAVRNADSGKGEDRLYFTWQGGGRRAADLELFRKAGVDVGTASLFHFYPKRTEERLAQLEVAYRNRSSRDIRRTYFRSSEVRTGSTSW